MKITLKYYYINMIFNIKTKNELQLLDIILAKEITKEFANDTYNNKLNNYRNKIDKINPEIWKKVRWYINNYDFLLQEPIINRAFYKYWEIINVFNIFSDENFDITDNIFHIAEAPGGFIQASNMILKQNTKKENTLDNDGFTIVKPKKIKTNYIYTISLNKDIEKYKDYNLPTYNKKIILSNVIISYGIDNTGDINNIDNIYHIKKLMGNSKSFLITGDGGFDEGCDFNNKEQLHFHLILNEIISALIIQKSNGHFILKMFDIFTNTSIHILYLLSLLYNEIYIYKPQTSRPTNSEKYIICKFFNCDDTFKLKIINQLVNLSNQLSENETETYHSFLLFNDIPNIFVNKINSMNDYLINNQCNALQNAILLCENKDFINNYDKELQKSLEKRKDIFCKWANKHNYKLK